MFDRRQQDQCERYESSGQQHDGGGDLDALEQREQIAGGGHRPDEGSGAGRKRRERREREEAVEAGEQHDATHEDAGDQR
jgi:hypothetical protein